MIQEDQKLLLKIFSVLSFCSASKRFKKAPLNFLVPPTDICFVRNSYTRLVVQNGFFLVIE